MPAALPLVAGYLVTGALEAAGAYVLASTIIGGIVAYGTAKVLGLDEQQAPGDPGSEINVRGTVEPLPIVYGRRKLGGILVQIVSSSEAPASVHVANRLPGAPGGNTDTTSTDNKFLNLVIAWCEGEVEGVDTFYFDETISVNSQFAGKFVASHHTGTDDQAADADFLAALANTYSPEGIDNLWSTNHKLSGVAYSWLKLEYDTRAWVGGLPQITCVMWGRKVLDLRDGVWKWSDNPALCIYDYLTNARFGRGIDPAELDADSFIDAANYCDQVIFIQVGDVPNRGVSQARYGCDAVLSPDNTCLDNLKVLLGTCRGALVFSGGLYKLKLDKPEVPSFALTADNILGGWSILLESSGSRYNRIHTQWRNKAERYQDDYKIVESSAYRLADGGEVLEAKIDLPATVNAYRPAQMAGMILRQSRYSLECEVVCTLEGLAVEVFDVVTVTHETPGWIEQPFRVMGVSLESDDSVRLQLRQYADAVFDLDSQNDEDSPAPTALPDPRIVPDVELFNAVMRFETGSGGWVRSYIYMSWTVTYMNVNVSHFRIKWKLNGSAEWKTVNVDYIPSPTNPMLPWFQNFELDVKPITVTNVEITPFNRFGVEGAPFAVNLTVPAPVGAGVPPSPPYAIHIAGEINGAVLQWTKGADAANTEIWRAIEGGGSTGEFSEAVKVATVTGSTSSYTLSDGVTLRFWLRSLGADGTPSVYTPASSLPGIRIVTGLPTFPNDAAALSSGLFAGDRYYDSDGIIRTVGTVVASGGPSISGTSGTLSDGSSVTIAGLNFGAKPNAAPIMWDDCSGTNVLSKWSGKFQTAGAYQEQYITPAALGRGVPVAHSHRTKYLVGAHEGGDPNVGVWKSGIANSGYFYASAYMRLDPSWPNSTGFGTDDNNVKPFAYTADSGGSWPYSVPYWYLAYATTPSPFDTTPKWVTDANAYIDHTASIYGNPPIANDITANWGKVEIVCHTSATGTGWLRVYQDGVLVRDHVGFNDVFSGILRSILFGGFSRTRGAGSYRYFSDMYIDNTLSRVVLTDSPTYSTSTIIEVQEPTAWSGAGNSIAVRLNHGALPTGTAYLYVFDSAGNRSNPYPVTLV